MFDTLSNAQIGSSLTVGAAPQNAVFSPDGRYAYIISWFDNDVSVIDVASRTVTTTIAVGTTPVALALSPDGKTLYVTNANSNSVSVISTTTNTVVGSPIAVGAAPTGVAISPDGTRVYVVNQTSNNVSIIDANSRAVLGTVGLGGSSYGVTVSPDGALIYVANQTGSVSVINAASQTVTATISLSGKAPLSVALSRDGSRLYVTTEGNNLVVINTVSNSVMTTISLPETSLGVTLTPDGTRAYVTAGTGVYVLDTATNTVVQTVSLPGALTSYGNFGTGFIGPNVLVASGGALSVPNDAALTPLGFGSYINFNGGTLRFTGAFNSARTVSLLAGGGTFDTNGFNGTLSGQIINTGSLTKTGLGTLTLTGANTYTGGTFVNGGTLALSGAGTLGDVAGVTTINSGGTLDLGGTTQTQSLVALNGGTIQNGWLNAAIASTGGTLSGIGGSAGLTTLSGTTTLLGTNSYTGATTVNGGVLDVVGAITGTSAVTVNAGGTLTGTGLVDPLLVSIATGGALAPGNGTPGSSLSIAGNLALQSGAIYLVQLNPTTASFTTVTGSAALGGATVNAMFANGSYVSKTYTILTASGGVSGSFGRVVNTNLPANFSTSLSYDANDAYLNLGLAFGIPGGLNRNQQAVGDALISYFNTNGTIPMVYGALTPAALTQASGELGTSPQQTTFNAMGQFMGLLTDPTRDSGPGTGSTVLGFADTAAAHPPGHAFAMFGKAPPAPAFESRWNVWAAGFGGSQSTAGNTIVGSNNTTSSIYGTAVGADYRLAPQTLAGFALAGGGTNFSVSGLGSGRSDLFQAAAYLRHASGPAYLTAALAYGWQNITTDRTVTIAGADRLRAQFDANAGSARLEGGYRFVSPWGGIGITPYAAAQVTALALPAYAEQVLAGGSSFALSYAAKSVTDTRSELGLRSDRSFALPDGTLTLRGRLAWAHDFNPNRSIAATFQALPGASFVVSGAALASESALTTASAEMSWRNGWSAAATFEGEFSNVTRSYAGKGMLRYQW
ncbi:autotransporter domain-containing protein [Bradyrhizobium sp. INPA01-394B]|uniref:Autotransporter domain-containing protein n=1 Tax=Bradyrhizobium campsiandrae TaxID=1729892 RepID=A0ABR7U2Y8_9BRAD|nr:autotransporter domain-containing protein [Bradyrhizobium campsiandrae]MBC9876164.1 autotransporter domain-containing protein [Bradyrhizobium campsiandrae]MBC9977896.1 autotransporter domain-containing protein [Bradyrhizobium campsiandrae]